MLVASILASVATGLMCGVLPAWQAYRKDAGAVLQDGARGTLGGDAATMRQALVSVQLALTTALLACAALLLHSFVNVTRADRGYEVEHVLAVELSPVGERYATGPQRTAFYRGLLTEVRALPGVLAAGAVNNLPALGESGTQVIFLSTDTNAPGLALQRPVAGLRNAMPGYFTASGTVLSAGRAFTDQDVTPVAVIGESLGRRLWPGATPASWVGRTIRQGAVSAPDITVVGVAQDVRPGALDRELPPQLYRPHHQAPSGRMTVVVRTAQDPSAMSASLRDLVRRADPTVPIATMHTMEEIVSGLAGATPVSDDADVVVRTRCAAARGGWRLRRRELHRRASDARDWIAARAWRDAAGGHRLDLLARYAAGFHRGRSRRARRDGRRADDASSAVRRWSAGPRRVRRRRARAAHRRGARLLSAGPTRRRIGSAHGPAARLGPKPPTEDRAHQLEVIRDSCVLTGGRPMLRFCEQLEDDDLVAIETVGATVPPRRASSRRRVDPDLRHSVDRFDHRCGKRRCRLAAGGPRFLAPGEGVASAERPSKGQECPRVDRTAPTTTSMLAYATRVARRNHGRPEAVHRARSTRYGEPRRGRTRPTPSPGGASPTLIAPTPRVGLGRHLFERQKRALFVRRRALRRVGDFRRGVSPKRPPAGMIPGAPRSRESER